MSHINEALKKAQKERDARHLKYTGFLFARRKEKRALVWRVLLWSSFLLVLIFLGFRSYSWWDSRGKNSLASKKQEKVARPSRAANLANSKTSQVQAAARQETSRPKPAVGGRTSQDKALGSGTASRQKTNLSAEAFYEKGRRFHKSGRLPDAKRFYQEALRLDPGYVDALNNLGVLYMHDKDYPAAQKSFETAVSLKPGSVDPHYNLACLHAIRGETEQSLAHLRRAVSLDPTAKAWAQEDSDLESLRGLSEFEETIK